MTNEAEQRFKSLGTVTKRVSFPIAFWEEFEVDCKENFNDTYYLKIMADHEYRKSMAAITQLIAQDMVTMQLRLEALEEAILSLGEQTEEEDKKSSESASEEPRRRAKTLG